MPSCPRCQCSEVQRFGQSSNDKQRYRCKACGKTFVWKKPSSKRSREQRWFILWITHHYSVHTLAELSGHSPSKIRRIILYWLQKPAPASYSLERYSHLVLDGTYFHKDGCLLTFMNSSNQMILANHYVPKEGFEAASTWFFQLKKQGLNPRIITADGERSVLKALVRVWPQVKVQRCLYHIQHEACRWLRSFPKTEAAKALRRLLVTLPQIRSVKERHRFLSAYHHWLSHYQLFVLSLPMNVKANLDIKRTMTLLQNALPDMFHYLMDPQVHSTTNALEGWHSRIKRAYRQHAGLSQRHKIQFLKWYSYFENQQKINNL